ncbi:sensor histidine kinase [Micromonospora coerulea]|uniref:sensor histidine kinase n=1 Tax=Micromonospora coerulea TaxID=47856 RepID=UPI001907B969|nr:sensor histidine kinase [Micromonospora veneta]
MRRRHGFRTLLRGLRRALAQAEVPCEPSRPVAGTESGLMLRVLCHEFRAPVSTLTALTRALADDRRPLTGDDRRAISQLARDQAVHLDLLLRAMVADTGALALTRADEAPVPLSAVLPSAMLLVPPDRLRVSVTRRAAAWPVCERRTRQVLTNLVSNALRHGPRAGEIGVRAAVRRTGLSLLVTDQGRISPALREALRRPAPAVGMHGIGLWIVRELVAADGGTVRALALRPRGVAVEVRLPGPTG